MVTSSMTPAKTIPANIEEKSATQTIEEYFRGRNIYTFSEGDSVSSQYALEKEKNLGLRPPTLGE